MDAIKSAGYNIYFNDNCYSYLAENIQQGDYSKIFILADTNTSRLCLPLFLPSLVAGVPVEIIEIDAGEEYKTLETCTRVWEALTELGADRRSLLINLGGGVVTDLGGFVAAAFKRGMDFINVPTTLLAMVDASVGGKTGVDLGNIKNQVGVIKNPVAVLIDTAYLDTLPQQELRSGLAEMLKHGLIADKNYWNNFTSLSGLTTDDFLPLIHRSVTLKNEIVQQDPYEKNVRRLLNFGHTSGHAIETYFLNIKKPLLHGEAVAIGMVLEACLSFEKKLLPAEEYIEIRTVITSIFDTITFSAADIEEIIALMVHDKKNEFGKVNFVLLEKIGKGVINQPVEKELIIRAFDDYSR
ncbi:3-dehydroquinate synthase [Flavobacterium cyanobacteriorum]|uniref:3-dehydroquinate synthase n=1 Tax=Flavobacterium cyanobacteriorum TaxID=2022802 RepID=A0A255Z7A5_9FLAO|nr:3-dehydroquinate synthase [Flavobacterium cyanobacteriorum]OYQ36775.1 3-dehydroquinate synthase [Flavobacterium cyanobacteriorum]